MNRDVKFRSWCESIKEMRPVQNIDTINKILSSCETDYFLRYEDCEGNDFEAILMQCTGLKDKNGVDIYEGDIVMAICKLSTSLEPVRYEISWDKSNCNFFGIARPKFPSSLEDRNNYGIGHLRFGIEVIGNIYENIGDWVWKNEI